MQDLVTELEQAMRAEILADLRSPAGDAELNSMGLGELLPIYGNWRSRLVSPHPRQVHRSSELRANPESVQYSAALDAIESGARAGTDLAPHLSRGIIHAYEPSSTASAELRRRRDRDLMVAEWGVHHLHLTTQVEADGFVERTPDLLFAAFADDDAYFIDIYPHDGSWALKDVVRKAVRNWPQAGLFQEMVGAAGIEASFSDGDRLQLRQAGATSFIEVDGRFYAPPGLTTAGTPIAATRASMTARAQLNAAREALSSNPAWLDDIATQAGSALTTGTQWTPHVNTQREFGFLRDGYFIPIGSLP